MTEFLSGVDYEMQQKRREQLLDVTASDVKKVAEEFLVKSAEEASIAVLGPKKDWVKEANGWSVKDLGMAEEVVEDEDGEGVLASVAASG